MADSKGNSKGNRPNRPVRPRQAPGGRKRRVVIDSGAARPRQDSRQARERTEPRPKSQPGPQPTGPVTVPSGVSVKDLSQALGVPAAQIIKIMMGLGEMVTITQSLSDDAVNKIDRPDADPQRVRQELTQEDLQPEEWGGATQYSDVSAREKQNLDDLLEKVLLVADAELELKANPTAEASGPIIESRLDVGRGPVATMLVQRGTLRVGDVLVAGDAWGKVRALYNYKGERVKEAKPGDPIEILGFNKPPPAGEMARVVENERQARHLAQNRAERLRREQLAQRAKGVSLESLFAQMQEGGLQELNIVLKGDVVGSVE